jgi:SulP family sulfate permease
MAAIQNIRKQFSTWKTEELRPAALGASVLAGLLTYLFAVILVISYGALVFSGELARQLPLAIGSFLAGNAILLGLTALFSSYSGSLSTSQDAPGAVIAVASAAMVASLPAASGQQFATVMVMIALITLATGALFLIIGIFRLGGLARFLPYPVMGGFLAGTGWLLAKGGISTMTGTPLGAGWFDSQMLAHWLPGVALGVLIFAAVSRFQGPLTLPVVLALGTILFYAVAAAANVALSQLDAEGWLVGSVPSGSLLQLPLSPQTLSQVDWGALWSQIPALAPAAVISVIALLLNLSGLELVIKKDVDLNRELVAAGVSNLAAGSVGGLTGYHAISLSVLNYKVTGGKRLVGLMAALLLVVTVFAGAAVLAYIPRMILGAVLVYLGVGLLVEWVFRAWSRFPLVDFLIILSILGAVIFGTFLNAVILGLVLAIIMFVVSYSRVGTVRQALSGSEYRSRVIRSIQEQQVLDARGDQLYVVKLQGFVFFGTANGILDQLRTRVGSKQYTGIRFVLLDFRQVTGVDSTALLSFTRMLQWGHEENITFVFTGLDDRARQQFSRGGFREEPGTLQFFADLDHGVEWCENDILAEAVVAQPASRDLVAQLKAIMGKQSGVEKLLKYLHRREYSAGEYVIQQGDDPDELYFVESGQVTAQLEASDHTPIRLETTGGGRSVGELGFYLDIKRTASVVADQDTVIYSLSKQELEEVEKLDPEAAYLLHRTVLYLLGERVVRLTRVVDALER